MPTSDTVALCILVGICATLFALLWAAAGRLIYDIIKDGIGY